MKETHRLLLFQIFSPQFPLLLSFLNSFPPLKEEQFCIRNRERARPYEKKVGNYSAHFDTFQFFFRASWNPRRPYARVPRVRPRKRNGNASGNGAKSGRGLKRVARMRAHHSWRPRVAESWVRSCLVRGGDSGPSADFLRVHAPICIEGTVAASATATVGFGFRRERTATNRQDEAQNATGEFIRILSLSFSLGLSRSRESASFWLSSSRLVARGEFLGLPSRSTSRKSDLRVVGRGAIVAAKRSDDATARSCASRGESWVRFLWLAPGARRCQLKGAIEE